MVSITYSIKYGIYPFFIFLHLVGGEGQITINNFSSFKKTINIDLIRLTIISDYTSIIYIRNHCYKQR